MYALGITVLKMMGVKKKYIEEIKKDGLVSFPPKKLKNYPILSEIVVEKMLSTRTRCTFQDLKDLLLNNASLTKMKADENEIVSKLVFVSKAKEEDIIDVSQRVLYLA